MGGFVVTLKSDSEKLYEKVPLVLVSLSESSLLLVSVEHVLSSLL